MKKLDRMLFSKLCCKIVFAVFSVPWSGYAAGLVAVWSDGYGTEHLVPAGVANIKSVAGGFSYSLALRADGRVLAWGDNYLGRASVPAGLANVQAISAGHHHNLAAKADGRVLAWGGNPSGETNVPPNLANVVAVAAGFSHSLALKADGLVVAWGSGSSGKTNIPPGLSNVVAIAAGWDHSLAVKADGTVTAWGDNGFSQTNVPVGLSKVTAVAGGAQHSLALKSDGTVVAWGYYWYEGYSVPAWVPPSLSNVVAIATGADHSLALKNDGTIVAWGSNWNNQTNVPSVLTNVTAIAAGAYHSLALVFEGPPQIVAEPASQEAAWGTNVALSVVATGRAPLGYQWFFNGVAVTNSPRVSGAATPALNLAHLQFSDVGSYTVIVSNAFGSVISSGAVLTVLGPPLITQAPLGRTVGAGADVTFTVTAEGTPPLGYQWSFNGTPLAGATKTSLALTNVQPPQSGAYAVKVGNAHGSTQAVAQLSVTNTAPYFLRHPSNQLAALGGRAVFSVLAKGSLPLGYQWRFNGNDLPGATNDTLTLENLTYAQSGYYNVVVRNAYGEVISAKALLSVVQAYVWTDYYSYGTPTNVPPGLTNLVAVAAGNYHVLVLKDDGRVATWVGTSTPATNVPASVTNVTAIAAGGDCSMAVRSNGTVVVWGSNTYGQANVPQTASNVVALATGGGHCLALRSNGTVVAWGYNSYGQASVPPGLSNVVGIAAGESHNLVLRANGTVLAWGNNYAQQTNVPPGLSNVIAVAAGGATSSALLADGRAVTWGQGPRIPQVGWTNLVSIACSSDTLIGLRADGTVAVSSSQNPGPAPTLSNVAAVIAGGGSRSLFYVALIGNGAPAITIQPRSQIVTNGVMVSFHARAAGAPPLYYQWQHEGRDLPGATNGSLTLTNVQGRDTGRYRAVISNLLGSVTSLTASLTIPSTGTLATALNATNLNWSTGSSNTAWFVQIQETHDGVSAAQSGPISHNQQSVLQTAVTGPGTLTFWWKVSSEEGFDFLRFYLGTTNTPRASISGEADWEQRTFEIPSGQHSLWWIYRKDGSVNDGRDAGWVDQVAFTPAPPVITLHPFSRTTWAGSNTVFAGAATGGGTISFQWLKNGTNLAGATQTALSLHSVTRRSAGVYALEASNAGGRVVSSNATLIVRVPQRLLASARLADGTFVFTSGDADGGLLLPGDLAGFEVLASTNLAEWTLLPNALVLTNGVFVVHDPAATHFPGRFYRLRED